MSDVPGNQPEHMAVAPGATAAAAPTATSGQRVRRVGSLLSSDLGQLPVFIALVCIGVYFTIVTNGVFLLPRNLSELVGQIITIGLVALGAVLVLLIGEIDLSLAAVAYLCGAFTVVLSARQGWNPLAAILGGLALAVVIGAVNGFLVAVVRVPSFIVTLAGLIGYQGLLLHILLPQTTVPLRDSTLQTLAIYSVPDILGVGLPVLALVVLALATFATRVRRQRAGLEVDSLQHTLIRFGIAVVIVAVVLWNFESYRGVPLTGLILVGTIMLFWLITRYTAFGRHIYAVGGNAEAARRAGINVTGLRVAVFTLAALLAAAGGILQASRQVSASSAVDNQLLLNAIAAGVLGGVSLFGGRGSVWSVVLGSLIVGSLINGLALTGQGTDIQQMVEGIVLLVAVMVDALLRRRSATYLR